MYCPNTECPDFLEDGRPGEYVDTVTVCPKCGAALVPDWPPETEMPANEPAWDEAAADESGPDPTPPPPAGLLVAVAAFDYPDEAQALVAALAERGIVAYQFFDDGRDFADDAGIAHCTRVLVPESQARSAAALAARHRGEP